MKKSPMVRHLATLVASVGLCAPAFAATYTFTPSVNTATNWGTTTAWSPNGTPGSADTIITSVVTGSNILTVDGGSRTVLNLTGTQNTTDWLVTGAATPTTLNITGNLTKGGSGSLSFLGGDATNMLTVNAGNIINTRGTLAFGAASRFVSAINVTGSTVLDGTTNSATINLNMVNGGTASLGRLVFAGGNNTVLNIRNTTSSGTAPVVVNGISGVATGAIQNAGGGGVNTYGSLVIDATGSASYAGAIRNNSGVVANQLAVIKSGTGTQVFTGTGNTYSGGTTINAGTILVNNASGNGLGTGAILVGASGTLGGTGFMTQGADASVTINGTLAVGDGSSAQTLDINTSGAGALALTSTSRVVLDIWTNAVSGVDKLVTTGAVTIAPDATLQLVNTGGVTFAEGDQFDLFDWGTNPTGGAFSYILPSLGGGLLWDTSALYSTGLLTVVPEPGTVALLAMGATLVLGRMAVRRKRFSR